MKQKLLSPYVAILALAALFWGSLPAIGAETPATPPINPVPVTPSDASLMSILPTPQSMGPNWVWPWNAPNNQAKISAENWKSQFWGPQDPRPMLTKKWIDLERTTDADFQKNSSTLGRVIQVLGAQQMPLSRTEMINELKAQLIGLTDFAYGSYNRVSNESGSATTPETDFISLKLSAFTDHYIQQRANLFNLTDAALASAFAATRETRDQVHKAREEQTAVLLKAYEKALLDVHTFKKNLDEMRDTGIPKNVIANAERGIKVKELAAQKVGIQLDQVIGHLGAVQGATLRGADGGYMVWSIEKNPQSKSIRIGGKLREQNIVLEFGRSITGEFDRQAALDDTVRILTLLSSRIKTHLNQPNPEGTQIVLNIKNELQVAFDSKYTKPTDPASLTTGDGELPTFIAATSRNPLEAAGPRKAEPAEVAERFSKIIPPPLPSNDDSPALKALKDQADKAYGANQLDEALTLYSKLAVSRPLDPAVQVALGRTFNYLDDLDAAIRAYTKVYELAPQTPNVRTWLAELYLAKGDRSRAAQWIGDELNANPNSAWAHSWLASTHLEIGDPSTAKSSFQKAMGLDPKVAGYRFQNGTALKGRKLYRRALTEFAAATYLDPTDPRPYLGVASCYEALQEKAAATQWYERYLQLDPTGDGAAIARKALLKLNQNP